MPCNLHTLRSFFRKKKRSKNDLFPVVKHTDGKADKGGIWDGGLKFFIEGEIKNMKAHWQDTELRLCQSQNSVPGKRENSF
jgi:hypothetical protein